MNEVFNISCKAFMTQVFSVLGIIVELSISILKPKGYLESYTSIIRPSVIGTYNSPVIYSSLLRSCFLAVFY